MKPLFCSLCGNRLKRRQIESRERDVCPSCGFVYYPQLIVGAGALIEQREGLLLVRRATQPFLDSWGLPAGHVEADENPADAAVRETMEETGLRISVASLVDAYFFDDHPKGNGVFLVYACVITGGTAASTIEASQIGFFRPSNLPKEIAGGGHHAAIRDWKAKQTAARQTDENPATIKMRNA